MVIQAVAWEIKVKFVIMNPANSQRLRTAHVATLIVDMCDCYTWSFPEFIPFCSELYYFSSLKDFKAAC